MENNVPDLPTVPMPIAKPLRKRPKTKLWLLGALIAVILALLLGLGMGDMFLKKSPTGNSPTQAATSTSIALQHGQPTSTVTVTSPQATATAIVGGTHTHNPTPIVGAPSVTHGRPHLGGPFTDFVGKYGMPANQGDGSSEDFWVGTDQSIDINVSHNEQGEVTQLDVLGPLSWTTQQATSYCAQFLPDSAVQSSATATQVDYHTSAGNVELTLQTHSCLLVFSHT